MLGGIPMKTEPFNQRLNTVTCAFGTYAYIVNLKEITSIPEYSGVNIDAKLFCDSVEYLETLFKSPQFNFVYITNPLLISTLKLESTISPLHNVINIDYMTNSNQRLNLSGYIMVSYLEFISLLFFVISILSVVYLLLRGH